MSLTAQALRDMKSNIFATYDSIEEVIERSGDSMAVMIAVNTTLELLAQSLESQESSYDLRAEEAERNGGGE